VIDGGKNKSYWDDVEIIAKSTLKKLRENRRRSNDGGVMHSLVQEEVLKIFKVNYYLIREIELKANLRENLIMNLDSWKTKFKRKSIILVREQM
jgi:hypothetical protein